jgi:ATP-binding cassette subfamily F protein uup
LAVLFRNPNFLVLDEPTNDLDLPTLGVLETFLADFPGCLMIVSHDRYFMDKLVDHLLVFEGDGVVRDFPGNYSDYRFSLEKEAVKKDENESVGMVATKNEPQPVSKMKPSFKEKREFELLEKEIRELTLEKQEITERLGSGNLPFEDLQKLSNRIGDITSLLDDKEMRWLELSEQME